MKLPGYVVLSCCLLGPALCGAERSNIYAFTAADGSVSLSNVPADNRYEMFVRAPNEAVGAIPLPESDSRFTHARKALYGKVIEEVARAHGLEGALLHAVVSVESRYNSRAVSSKGAVGLMQLMPATAKRYGVSDSFDPMQNLQGGAKYLRDLLTLFNNDMSLALAAYNAGEQAVIRNGNRIPPFQETRQYVPRALDYYSQYQARL
ncbi:MAG: lytic transglycosylase domain-containing protein [Gallionellaceae bacterium]|jgi:soluble lytic murein transglycosylase-like protein